MVIQNKFKDVKLKSKHFMLCTCDSKCQSKPAFSKEAGNECPRLVSRKGSSLNGMPTVVTSSKTRSAKSVPSSMVMKP
uniref:Uncharacterized protein n=1 Tax=Romanomermis culicivorax TaxID=13658 RepID=A0A915HV03_ROMCU